MTIANEITKLNTNLTDSYTAVSNKGGTIPSSQNFDNLATSIATIPTGSTPTGTISITQNGIYDVTNYASADVSVSSSATLITKSITQNGTYNASSDNADGYSSVTVNVPSSIGIPREVSANGKYQIPSSSFTFSLPSNATDLGYRALYYALSNCTGLNSIDFLSLTTISGNFAMFRAFDSCLNLTTVDLSNLTTISGTNAMNCAFESCSRLTSVNLSNLTTIGLGGMYALENAFAFTGITSLSFPSLTTLQGNYAMRNAFQNCTSLTTLSFPSLTSRSFGLYSNQFNGMLSGVTGCTVHFPSNLQSLLSNWSDVTAGFGGTNTTVLFDLT